MRFLIALSCCISFMLMPLAHAQAKQDGEAEALPPIQEKKVEEVPDVNATPKPSEEPSYGLLGPVRFGATVAAEFPHLLNYSLELKYKNIVGFAFSLGRFKTEVKDIEVEMRNWDVRARWFPWEGSFFMGAAYGKQGLVGKYSKDLKTDFEDVELKIPATIRLEVETTYLTPHIGWFAVWDCGFTLGFELGYQLALSSKADLDTAFDDVSANSEDAVKNSDEYKEKKDEVEKLAEQLGKKSVPYMALLRIGWMI